MKKLIFILSFCVICLNGIAQNKAFQNKAAQNKVDSVVVTKSMSEKIAGKCLYAKGYYIGVFYQSNKELLTAKEIYDGKGREILKELHKHPQFAENFLRTYCKIWGYDNLKYLDFDEKEITLCKQIVNKCE